MFALYQIFFQTSTYFMHFSKKIKGTPDGVPQKIF
jgi:hypothetical protein